MLIGKFFVFPRIIQLAKVIADINFVRRIQLCLEHVDALRDQFCEPFAAYLFLNPDKRIYFGGIYAFISQARTPTLGILYRLAPLVLRDHMATAEAT